MEGTFKSYWHVASDQMSTSIKLENNQSKIIDDGSHIQLQCTEKEFIFFFFLIRRANKTQRHVETSLKGRFENLEALSINVTTCLSSENCGDR